MATHSSRTGSSRSCREQASILHGCARLAKVPTLDQTRTESIVIIPAALRWPISSCSRRYSSQRCRGRIADRTWVAIRSARLRIMTERAPKKTSERTDWKPTRFYRRRCRIRRRADHASKVSRGRSERQLSKINKCTNSFNSRESSEINSPCSSKIILFSNSHFSNGPCFHSFSKQTIKFKKLPRISIFRSHNYGIISTNSNSYSQWKSPELHLTPAMAKESNTTIAS